MTSIFDFNPRSHKGSDQQLGDVSESDTISIHAPTRGATWISFAKQEGRRFQSTLPQGERPYHGTTWQGMLGISIHAPTRGATAKDFNIKQNTAFQSTLPQGERPLFRPFLVPSVQFQSTLPQGERQQYLTKKIFLSSEIL